MSRRTLFALVPLLFVAASAYAEDHIFMSCSGGHSVKKTIFEDGRTQSAAEAAASPTLTIDVDLENKKINGFYDAPYGQQIENGSVNIGGYASKLATEHESGYQDSISIDRLSGTAIVTHVFHPADDCADHPSHDPSCLQLEIMTVYRCAPAASDFPTPIPRMLRSWERLRHYLTWTRMRRALRRIYSSIERHI
jgi:hypothetical protein